jgi:hypothetical protein
MAPPEAHLQIGRAEAIIHEFPKHRGSEVFCVCSGESIHMNSHQAFERLSNRARCTVPLKATLFLSVCLALRIPTASTQAQFATGHQPAGSNIAVTWTNPTAVLESSLSVNCGWGAVAGAASPYMVPFTNHASFYRLYIATGVPTPTPTQSSPIALTADCQLVAVNPDTNTVTLFDVQALPDQARRNHRRQRTEQCRRVCRREHRLCG